MFPYGVLKKRAVSAGLVVLALLGGPLVVAGPASAAPAVAAPAVAAALPPGGSFVPVTPTRVLDTRSSGGPVTATTADPYRALPGVPAASVAAVLLNVTVVGAVGQGFVAVGAAVGTSNGNYVAGKASATLALVRVVRAGDPIPVQTSVRANVVVDVQGYVTTPQAATTATFTPTAPDRVADTRSAVGLRTFGAGQTQSLDVRGRASLPADATAVVANVTVAGATSPTFVTAWSGTGARPVVSTVNAVPGDNVANRVLLPLDENGRASLYNDAGRTDLVVDVVGYVSPSADGSYYTPVTPTRLLDAPGTALTVEPTIGGPSQTVQLRAPSVDDLAPTTAVWFTLTADNPAGPGYLAARPGGTPLAGTSDLNLVPGRAVANAGPVTLSAAGAVAVASSQNARVIADPSGWFRRLRAGTPAAATWSSTRWPDYSAAPIRTSTVPTSLPAYFAGAVTVSNGARFGTYAYAVGPDARIHLGSVGAAQPGNLTRWTDGSGILTDLTGVTALAAAGGPNEATALYALLADGRVYGTGPNGSGEQARTPSPIYTQGAVGLIPLPRPAVRVAAAQGVGYAVLDDGSLYSWGRADTAQLGRVATSTPWVPAPVTTVSTPVQVVGDGQVSFALDADGVTTSWGTSAASGSVPVAVPTPAVGACAQGSALHQDDNGVWELCSDGTVVQLSDRGTRVATVLPVGGVTAIGAGAGYRGGIRALVADGRVVDVPQTGTARYESGFRSVVAVNGTPAVQVTFVGS